MKKFNLIVLASLLLCSISLASSCKKGGSPDVDKKPEEPEVPAPVDPSQKDAFVWVDARSNVFGTYGKFSNKEEIKNILNTLKSIGVTGLVLDVKGSTGYTMYPSAYTEQMTTLDGKTRPDDYVEFVISEAKKRNLKVYASIVTFVEGDGNRRIGTLFDDADYKSKYESIVADVNGNLVPITSTGRNGFVNPAAPEVQEKALNIVKEIVTKFNIDGIILDYARYSDIYADFSELSKNQFIKFLEDKYNDRQAKFMDFPKDIVKSWKNSSGIVVPNETGVYYKRWLVYRASVIKGFFDKARAAVKSVKADAEFGVYTGAWYTTYYQVGVNWASKDYDPFNDPEVKFDWASPGYQETGYAETLDLLMTGNYFTQIRLADNPATANLKYHWWSIEGSLRGAGYITKHKMPLYGSIDVGNVDYGNKAAISNAIKFIMNDENTSGIMLFDVVHMYAPEYNKLKQPLFDAIEAGLK